MCQRVNANYSCGHQAGQSQWYPEKPEDCQAAVNANRRNARSGFLLRCSPPETTANYDVGGHCEKPECKIWYLEYGGWICCACRTSVMAGFNTCYCMHQACALCTSAV
ncbi:hypothetical protein C7999DRAFT_18268 [Corynascus novoguineensis]|uniref:Uncharacterized protein n=1 Tax=Corynascus novoguineensis TaxID=1126955 RepID=A0AAN7CJP7_9PEZI|nr:hypothetical protein C7999DRAFT_18268 [Corynascus novoguineensis]